MAIIGVTHSKQGEVLVRRSVMTKVAIGRGPRQGHDYPEKLDHFIFLRKDSDAGGAPEWVEDAGMQEHYKKLAEGDDPTEIVIILLDDDIDQVFRTEYAWWAKTAKKCSGDGESAFRLIDNERKPWANCANSGKCKEYEAGECKPSADLYFMLADYPSLGTACRLHTSSYQSVRELYSALTDLKNMMGGRLLGLPVKLFVRPEKNTYQDGKGNQKTGTKWVLGLELRGESLPKLLENVTESAKVFSDLRKVMAGTQVQIDEDDDNRAHEIASEFVAPEKLLPAPNNGVPAAIIPGPAEDPNQKLFEELANSLGLNNANRHFLLARHSSDILKAIDELRAMASPSGATLSAGLPAAAKTQAGTLDEPPAGKKRGGRAGKPATEETAAPSEKKKFGF